MQCNCSLIINSVIESTDTVYLLNSVPGVNQLQSLNIKNYIQCICWNLGLPCNVFSFFQPMTAQINNNENLSEKHGTEIKGTSDFESRRRSNN